MRIQFTGEVRGSTEAITDERGVGTVVSTAVVNAGKPFTACVDVIDIGGQRYDPSANPRSCHSVEPRKAGR